MPSIGPARNAVLSELMGSGHPQQIGGFGGGCGPTSKVAIVGPHKEREMQGTGPNRNTCQKLSKRQALVPTGVADCSEEHDIKLLCFKRGVQRRQWEL